MGLVHRLAPSLQALERGLDLAMGLKESELAPEKLFLLDPLRGPLKEPLKSPESFRKDSESYKKKGIFSPVNSLLGFSLGLASFLGAENARAMTQVVEKMEDPSNSFLHVQMSSGTALLLGLGITAGYVVYNKITWHLKYKPLLERGDGIEKDSSLPSPAHPKTLELVKDLQNSSWRLSRHSAALALGMLGDRSARPALQASLLKDPKPTVRGGAARALGMLQDPAARPALEKALMDPDHFVRLRAIESLVKLDDLSAVPALVEAFPRRSDRMEKIVERIHIFTALSVLLKTPILEVEPSFEATRPFIRFLPLVAQFQPKTLSFVLFLKSCLKTSLEGARWVPQGLWRNQGTLPPFRYWKRRLKIH
jgi:hypothetical protein